MLTLHLPAALAALLAFAAPVAAHDGVHIIDPYVRVSSTSAKSGAVFFVIQNHAAVDDTLIAASTVAAERAELHTHVQDANGVMRMMKIEDGVTTAAGESHALDRGGDHVMLLGLTRSLAPGDTIILRLTFTHSGDVVVKVPVDNDRKPMMPGGHGGHAAP